MTKNTDLKLNCLGIGSLPYKDVNSAMALVNKYFSKIPFWPQLAKYSQNEDMIVQFLENTPGLVFDSETEECYLENDSETFFEQLEQFFLDYEEIISDLNNELLSKYAITENFSSTFKPFLEVIKKTKPKYAKGQVTGPFTLATTLCDNQNRCVFYDETLREIIVKILSLKALWQIKEIKKSNENTIPIIFIDEPSISQLGTSAFITVKKEEVVQIIKFVSDLIKQNGALSAIHCCGKCDWTIPIACEVDIINFDGYAFAQNFSLFSEELKEFLQNDGKIAWGIVPTLDKDALQNTNIEEILEKFEEATEYLTQKGIDKSLLINNSMVSTSCGAGSLSVDLAQKAMLLTEELSLKLKEKYKDEKIAI
jgi:methionine synthase II (cobalamin-independent)